MPTYNSIIPGNFEGVCIWALSPANLAVTFLSPHTNLKSRRNDLQCQRRQGFKARRYKINNEF